ncbi:hypothetical protein T265_04106 [Opisthorchis viverrini]|uniref:Uncharacterized protein n=1 Tax=Opisthorchis viverrini TaxID=6198 RepID=A0A075A165_OPIVI|nr:hypothetical protein T265_04106 [Opisthorchis viverrini]KER29265.1 hypothetical protein T265_04106 [Opisthorchis viverrini]
MCGCYNSEEDTKPASGLTTGFINLYLQNALVRIYTCCDNFTQQADINGHCDATRLYQERTDVAVCRVVSVRLCGRKGIATQHGFTRSALTSQLVDGSGHDSDNMISGTLELPVSLNERISRPTKNGYDANESLKLR